MSKIPESSLKAILERSGNRCEVDGCNRLDWRGLQCAHIRHRKMGGRKGEAEDIINDPRNIAYICCYHHDLIDGRVYHPYEKPKVIAQLKETINWDEWALEARAKGIMVRIC